MFPTTIPKAHAATVNTPQYWSAFGPYTDNLLYKVYSDFGPMFSDFKAGQLDITDWAIQAGDLSSFESNNDFFVSSSQPEFGIFELEFNHADPLLTVPWQIARTTSTPACLTTPAASCPSPAIAPGTPTLSITSTAACGATCPAGTFQLIINLQNIEEGNAPVTDPLNQVTATITGQPSASGHANAAAGTGTFTLPPLADLGVASSTYSISTTMYDPGGNTATHTPPTLATVTGTALPTCVAADTLHNSCTATFTVDYNSISTQKPLNSGIDMFRALAYLINKPQYLGGPYLSSGGVTLASCLDVFAPAGQHLFPAGVRGPCNPNGDSEPLAATIQADCTRLKALDPVFFATCTELAMYNLQSNLVSAAPASGAGSCAAGTIGISCFPSQNPAPTGVGEIQGYAGLVDLYAACTHLVAAGFGITGTGGCGGVVGCGNAACTTNVAQTAHLTNPQGSCNSATGVGCIISYVRSSPPRTAFGQMVMDELNYLFGTIGGGTVCYGGPPSLSCSLTPIYFNIAQVTPIVFTIVPLQDWNLYTGGYSLGTTPDHLYALHTAQFSGGPCGGASVSLPNDYIQYCDPVYDTQAQAGEFTPGVTLPAFQAAAAAGATRGDNVPVYAGVNRYAALQAWGFQDCGAVSPGGTTIGPCSPTDASIVPVNGHGFESSNGFVLNARPAPGFTPANPLYAAGSTCPTGTGVCLRRSMSNPTLHMTPWTFTTVWEAEPLSQFYDTLLATDPNSAGTCTDNPISPGTANCLDWMTTQHKISPNLPGLEGKTKYDFTLRGDLLFHDGQPVTGHDVCFSILSYRDAPSFNFAPSVAAVQSCTVSGNIVTVIVNGVSPFDELNLGGVFIVPEHIWAPICTTPATANPAGDLCTSGTGAGTANALASTATDYVALGDMVGSGPWFCNSSVGVSTISGQSSCTQSAAGVAGGQALSTGGRIFLKRNLNYMRCCPNAQAANTALHLKTSSLQALEFSNFQKTGKVSLNDILSATAFFGQGCTSTTSCYFADPAYSTGQQGLCNAGQTAPCVDVDTIGTIAGYYGHGTTGPYTGASTGFITATVPSGLLLYDPNVDPFIIGSGANMEICTRATTTVVCTASGTVTNAAHLTLGTIIATASATNALGKTSWTFSNAGFVAGQYTFSIDNTPHSYQATLQ